MSSARPRLRPLDIFPVQAGGETHFCIRDPEGIANGMSVVNGPTLLIASLMNGRRTVEEICGEFQRAAKGMKLDAGQVTTLIGQLDENCLLEGGAYARRRKEIEEEFEKAAVRPATLAGAVYEEDAGKLGAQLDGFYKAEGGAGWPETPNGAVRGVISPHIDYPRGGYCYTHAYAPLVGSKAEAYVILGVAHASPPVPYVVAPKAYATPLGEAPAEEGILDALKRRAPKECFTFQATHRMEHSIELQVVFLQHALKRTAAIVPVLCGSFEMAAGKKRPREVGAIEEFVGALKEATQGREVVFISGADLAHIGPRFGDEKPITPEFVKWMEAEDVKTLAQVQMGSADGFYESVTADGNTRKVCGLSSIWTFLRMLEGVKGDVRRYGYAPDPAGGVVSFASVVFQ